VLHFEAVRRVLQRFGHESESSKEQPASEVVVLLGVELNLITGKMKLAKPKRESYAKLTRSVAGERVCERERYESLMGKLTFAASCYPRGRQWLHAPWRAARAAFRTAGGGVVISAAVREALVRWAVELEDESHEGVPLGARDTFPSASSAKALVIYADAALECPLAG
jgi:hypothetical protein